MSKRTVIENAFIAKVIKELVLPSDILRPQDLKPFMAEIRAKYGFSRRAIDGLQMAIFIMCKERDDANSNHTGGPSGLVVNREQGG